MNSAAAFDTDMLASFIRSIERYIAESYPFETQQRLAATTDGFGREQWREIAELGWLALPIEAEHGGLGGGGVEIAILMEAIGGALVLEPVLASVVLSGYLIAQAGTQAQKAELLPKLASGDRIAAFAHEDLGPAATAAPGASEGARLSGRKTFVLHGDVADLLVVSAQEGGETGLFVVDADAPGVLIERHRLLDSRGVAEIAFADSPASRLGSAAAAGVIGAALERATVAVCAEAVGAIAALNAQTLAYAKIRHQFGDAIGHFQAIQHRLVDMAVAEQEARAITRAATMAIDVGHPRASLIVSAAKARLNHASRFVGESAIQIHGGVGMTDELMAGHLFKRMLLIGSLFGDTDTHLDRLAAAT